jgi:outer membrane protein assembly factor BamB
MLWCFASTAPLQAENWPQFRGPTGQGISTETNLPTRWSVTENVDWKTEVPGEGWSSPIVWEDRIFLTSATEAGISCRAICLDRKTGRILWNTEVVKQTPTRKENKNSFASPTPITDGERVYVVFADGTLAALAFDGSIAWTNHDVKFYSKHGLGASPRLDGERLLMPFDGSSPGDDKEIGWKKPWDKSFLLALDKQTGKALWKGERGLSRIAHVTPNVLRANGQTQIISGAGDVVQGFEPETGKRIWSVYSQGEGVTPSVVIGDGLIFTASGFEKPTIRAIRPGGSGDVTQTHIAWEQTKGVPSLSSLLYVKPHLYAVTDAGVATCYEAATGDLVWQERIGGNHSASPIFADGKIYFLSEQGETTVIETGPEFKIVARNPLEEKCQASIAASQRHFYIRTERHVFCIGAPQE